MSDDRIRILPVREGRPPALGQAHGAEWRAGWAACEAEATVVRASALEMGYRQGLQAGRCVGPSWVNVGVCSTFAFILGFTIAIAYFS